MWSDDVDLRREQMRVTFAASVLPAILFPAHPEVQPYELEAGVRVAWDVADLMMAEFDRRSQPATDEGGGE